MSRSSTQLSSRSVAVLAGVGNLVVCGVLYATWTVVVTVDSPVAPATPLGVAETTQPERKPSLPDPATTTASASDVSGTLERVRGPAGLSTVVPGRWPVSTLPEPGSMQATDPADSRVVLKFGGAPPENSTDIHTYHLDYERKIAKRPGYRMFGLARTTVRGHEAVDWEFEWSAPEGRRHVRAVYWRSDGIEYFVYAHSSTGRWSEISAVLTAMLTHATP